MWSRYAVFCRICSLIEIHCSIRTFQGRSSDGDSTIPRSKPFKYTYEKEIVMYAHLKKLDFFSTECIYSPNAYRGHARTFIKGKNIHSKSYSPTKLDINFLLTLDLEKIRASAIMDIIHSGEQISVKSDVKERLPTQGKCKRCGYISSMEVCKACLLLDGLNSGMPKLKIG